MGVERRTLLKVTGTTATAATVGLAGCLDSVGLGGDETDGDEAGGTIDAAYADWLTFDGEELTFTYADVGTIEELANLEDEMEHEIGGITADESESDGQPLTEKEDLMLSTPVLGGVIAIFSASFGLWGTGLEGLVSMDIDTEMGGEQADFETSVDELLSVRDAVVFGGDIDTDEIHDAVTSEPDTEFAMKTVFERTTERSGYDIYEPVADDEAENESFNPSQNLAIAVSDDALVVGGGNASDGMEAVREPIEARAGEATTAAEANDDISWLLANAADGDLAFGGYGSSAVAAENETDENASVSEENDRRESLEDARGFVSSISLGTGELHGSFAAVFESIDDDTEAELEATVGSSADDVTLEIDDGRVTASATWNENLLG